MGFGRFLLLERHIVPTSFIGHRLDDIPALCRHPLHTEAAAGDQRHGFEMSDSGNQR